MKLPSRFLLPHRLLLRLAPRDFRDRHGRAVLRGIAHLAARGRRRDGAPGVRAAWRLGLRDVAGTALVLRRDALLLPTSGSAMLLRDALSALVHAPRRLLRAPGFTLPALLSLSLGMGAAAGAFSLVDAAFLRPLPYSDAEELVVVHSTRRGEGISVAYPDFQDWREQARAFQGMAAYTRTGVTLTGDGPAEVLAGLTVTADLFPVLEVTPALGSLFQAEDDLPGAPRTVILSHPLWQDRFGGDPGVLGTTLLLDGESYAVRGVLPPGFDFPDGAILGSSDLYLPAGLQADRGDWNRRDSHPGLYVVARLNPGTSVEAGRMELEGVAARLAQAYPDSNAEESVVVEGLRAAVAGDLREALTLLGVAGVLVFLVAAANVTGLFLARVSSRGQEVAVRAALGAGRRRVAFLFLGESLWLGLTAGAAGAGLAAAGLRLAHDQLSRFSALAEAAVDLRVLGLLLAAVLTVAVAVGVVPALRAATGGQALPGRTPGSRGRREARLRDALVVAEVALAVALLFSAGLLGRSFARMAGEEGGLDPSQVAVFRLSLPEADYPEWSMTRAAYGEVESRLAALPGVEAVGGISTLPFSGAGAQSGMRPAGGTDEESVRTDVNVVTPGYFQTMGIPLLQGRGFGPEDRAGEPPVVVVDERFARRFWPGEDPLGKRVDGWGLQGATVVGVVGHVRNYGVLTPSREELYMPHAQRPYLRMWVAFRGTGAPEMAAAVREAVTAVDPDVPVERFGAMEAVVAGTLRRPRMAAGLGLLLAGLAAVLAVTGVYALMAFAVARRTREMGVRMALGATGGSVRGLVLRTALGRTAAGAGLGLLLALAAGGWLEGLAYGLPARDPVSLGVAVAVLLGAGLVAALVPAVRASRMDPVRVLREE